MTIILPESKLIQIDPVNSVRVFIGNEDLVKENEKKMKKKGKKKQNTKKSSF